MKPVKAKISDSWRLRDLIRGSLVDFAYYPEQKIDKIRSQHRVWDLIKARLNPDRTIYLIKDDSRLVAYLIGHNQNKDSFSLDWIYVIPKYRSRGLAKALLIRLEEDLAKKGLAKIELISYNAGGYYQQMGYKFVSKLEVENQLIVERYQKRIKGESRA
ncbi:GNAT family N-acetyltransferase [Candidatus Saccharibacteria bacterium]|nr:GNAT family N-acetyltransferase [Candidatus Saccharibacteria bacterium]